MANESNDQEAAFQDALTNAESLSPDSTVVYDRLWHLGNHLRSITSPQDQAPAEMHPEHAAIVLTDDEQRFIAAASRYPSPSAVANAIQRLALARRNPSQSFSQALSARRTMLEATLRQLRRSSDPNDPSTSLGRRVMVRVAATSEERATDAGALPEPRPNRSTEPRAATHLRHSFLPNPPSSVRPGVPRALHNSPGEYRPRIMRNESTTTQNVNTMSSQMSSDDEFHRPRPADTAHGSYRVRRRINSRGQEHVTSINWHDSHPLHSEVATSAPDPWTWVDAARPGRPQHTAGSEHVPPADPISGGQRRHRGWARLDADGDEISIEAEEFLERGRVTVSEAQHWNRPGHVSARVLDLVQHHTTTEYPDSGTSGSNVTVLPPLSTIIDPMVPLLEELFVKGDMDAPCPLPTPLSPRKSPRKVSRPREVRVTMNVDAGR